METESPWHSLIDSPKALARHSLGSASAPTKQLRRINFEIGDNRVGFLSSLRSIRRSVGNLISAALASRETGTARTNRTAPWEVVYLSFGRLEANRKLLPVVL